jgi:aralkylamine N-acetyltransferase
MSETYKVQIVTELPSAEVMTLYLDGGWWKEEWGTVGIPELIAGSFRYAAAIDANGKVIGVARAISDGVSDAYIQDVVVSNKHRKQGIGSALIKLLIFELQAAGVDWIGLIGKPGTGHFYESLNFKKLKNFIPMELK